MDDVLLMCIVQRPGNRGEEIATLGDAYASAALEQLGQAFAFNQFHGDIGAAVAGGFPHLQRLDNMRVAQTGDGAGFLAEALADIGIGAGQQHF